MEYSVSIKNNEKSEFSKYSISAGRYGDNYVKGTVLIIHDIQYVLIKQLGKGGFGKIILIIKKRIFFVISKNS